MDKGTFELLVSETYQCPKNEMHKICARATDLIKIDFEGKFDSIAKSRNTINARTQKNNADMITTMSY